MASLVKDKFEKHLIMMEQNGLGRLTYWTVTYLFNYMLYIPIAVEIVIISLAFQIRLFTQVRKYTSSETLSKLSENHKINVIGPTKLKLWPLFLRCFISYYHLLW